MFSIDTETSMVVKVESQGDDPGRSQHPIPDPVRFGVKRDRGVEDEPPYSRRVVAERGSPPVRRKQWKLNGYC